MKKFLIIFLILLINFCSAQVPKIDDNRLNEYKNDMNNFLNKILFEKTIFEGDTCPEAIDKYYKMHKNAYEILLKDKNNLRQKQIMFYSYDITTVFIEDLCDKIQDVIRKYNTNYYNDYIEQGLNCQYYYAKRFLEPYNIKNTDKYIEFMKKIDSYALEMYKKLDELDLFNKSNFDNSIYWEPLF